MTELYIGGSASGTIAFSALSTPVREPSAYSYFPYAESIETVGGSAIGRGNPYIRMEWKNITRPERDMLRTFCTTPAAIVYIYAPENDSNKTFHLYQATMIWPDRENYRHGNASDIITDFIIKFKSLVQQ